jgi:DNA-binding NarL/FixJ family response regulator
MTACAGRAIVRWVGTSVLIVDDHEGFRAWARVLLEQAGYTVLGEAADGASAVRAARRLRPRVVLLDVQLPDTDGFQVARRLSGQRWSPAVVLISTREASDYAGRLERSRVRGFLTKEELTAEALSRLVSARDGGDPGDERRPGGCAAGPDAPGEDH